MVCEDGKLVRGHKIILRAGSALIKNLLAQGLYLYLYLFCIWLCVDQESSCWGFVFVFVFVFVFGSALIRNILAQGFFSPDIVQQHQKEFFPVHHIISNWELSFCSRIKTSTYSARSSSTTSHFSNCQVIFNFLSMSDEILSMSDKIFSLLRFIYTGKTLVDQTDVVKFLETAKVFQVILFYLIVHIIDMFLILVLSYCPLSWYIVDRGMFKIIIFRLQVYLQPKARRSLTELLKRQRLSKMKIGMSQKPLLFILSRK